MTTDPAVGRLKKVSSIASTLGTARENLTIVVGLLANGAPDNSRIYVCFEEDCKDFTSFRIYGDKIFSGEVPLSKHILGATETTLREQIRTMEAKLRELGVVL